MFKYTITAKQGFAKTAILETPHGIVKTPVFMNVATQAAIKGALSASDLLAAGCQIAMSNTYHLNLRPGDKIIKQLGGLGRFMNWNGVTATDSGGFQVFSLAKLRKISEEGVSFASHINGERFFISPEDSINIQANLGADITLAFDECTPYPCDKSYMEESVRRTTHWLVRCLNKHKELTADGSQVLFGINQGGIYKEIRREHAKEISELDLFGYAIGGLAVGESAEEMYDCIETVTEHLPANKPTYLMGVGTPLNIIEAVKRGVDFFDCVLPARNGRHGHVFTQTGKLNLMNKQYEKDDAPIDSMCECMVCREHTRAYIRHLFKAREMLAMRLCVMHNLFFYNTLMENIRVGIAEGKLENLEREHRLYTYQ